MDTYRELEVWQRSIDLVEEVYVLCRLLPTEEKYGLRSQMQRCAVSIAANIAEGYGRQHRKEYLNHLSIASGSLAELETHLIISTRLKYFDRNQILVAWDLTQRVGKMLTMLKRSLQE